MRLFLVLTLLWFGSSAFAATVEPSALQKELEQHRLDVPEFKAIRAEAEKRGLRVFILGGAAASLAEHAKERLQPRAPVQAARYQWELDNILFPTQDVDLVITGAHGEPETLAQIDEFRNWVRQKFPRGPEGHSLWDVLGLKTAAKGKLALENNPDFLNQHNDSLSLGMLELTQPPKTESIVRDLSGKNLFLRDIAHDEITFLHSPLHETTSRFLAGNNPPILAAIRTVEKSLRYNKTIDPKGADQIRAIVKEWDPGLVEPRSYVHNYISGRGSRLLANAKDMPTAIAVLDSLGLRQRLRHLRGSDVNEVGSLAWFLNREPLPVKPPKGGKATGRTAGDLGITRAMHWTNQEAYEQITHSYDLKPRLLQSREGVAGEAAALGNGFYTFANTYERPRLVAASDQVVEFRVDPRAREGVDFTFDEKTKTVVWKSSRYLTLEPSDEKSYHLRPRLTESQRAALLKRLEQLAQTERTTLGFLSLDRVQELYPDASEPFWRLVFGQRKSEKEVRDLHNWMNSRLRSASNPTELGHLLPAFRAAMNVSNGATQNALLTSFLNKLGSLPVTTPDVLALRQLTEESDGGLREGLRTIGYRAAVSPAEFLAVTHLEQRSEELDTQLMHHWGRFRSLLPPPTTAQYSEFLGGLSLAENIRDLKTELLAPVKDPAEFLALMFDDFADDAFDEPFQENFDAFYQKQAKAFRKLNPSFEQERAFRDHAPTPGAMREASFDLAARAESVDELLAALEPKLPVANWNLESSFHREVLRAAEDFLQRVDLKSPEGKRLAKFFGGNDAWDRASFLLAMPNPPPFDELYRSLHRSPPTKELYKEFFYGNAAHLAHAYDADEIVKLLQIDPKLTLDASLQFFWQLPKNRSRLAIEILDLLMPTNPDPTAYFGIAHDWVPLARPNGAFLADASPEFSTYAIRSLTAAVPAEVEKATRRLKPVVEALRRIEEAGRTDLLRNGDLVFREILRALEKATTGQRLYAPDVIHTFDLLKDGAPVIMDELLTMALRNSQSVDEATAYIEAYTKSAGRGRVTMDQWNLFRALGPSVPELNRAGQLSEGLTVEGSCPAKFRLLGNGP